MPFYRGNSTMIEEVRGMFVSPDGKQWSSHPYTKEQDDEHKEELRQYRIYWEIYDYCSSKGISFKDAYNEIPIKKKSGLSARCKKYLTSLIENHEKDHPET